MDDSHRRVVVRACGPWRRGDPDGVQTKTSTQKVAVGDAPAVKGIVNTKCRVTIDGVEYGIVAVRDVAGDHKTLRVELRSTGE